MEEETKKPFCESCDSKGRVHKKDCPVRNEDTNATAFEGMIPQEHIVDPVRTEIFVEKSTPDAIRHPDIRAGVCEFCGQHHTDCQHYKGVDIYCTYCGRRDIISSRSLKVYSLKSNPKQLIIVCDDFGCSNSHINRFTKK